MFVEFQNSLPLAAIINDTVFGASGGLSPELSSLDQITQIIRPTDLPDDGLIHDLAWSYPDINQEGWQVESVGGGTFTYGSDVVTDFLRKNGFSLMLKSGRIEDKGYKTYFNDQLIGLFSSPDHVGVGGNYATFVEINEEGTPTINTFDSYYRSLK